MFFVFVMKNYSIAQIHRTLGKYELREREVEIGPGLDVRVAEVGDAYVILDSMVEKERQHQKVERFPYWAEIWPASLALSKWFYRNKLEVSMGWGCELGCGLGLVGIVLAKMGWKILATDFVEDALIFTAHNARLNRVVGSHQVNYLDWRNPVGQQRGYMVGSDLVYEKKNHPYLERVLRTLLQPGGRFYLGDPQRKAASDFVSMLRVQGYDHRVETQGETWDSNEYLIDIHVFTKP